MIMVFASFQVKVNLRDLSLYLFSNIFDCISVLWKLILQLNMEQKIIENTKTDKNQSMPLIISMDAFQIFLQGIPDDKLEGLQSQSVSKLDKIFPPLSLEDIKILYQEIVFRDIWGKKKNWKQDQVILLIYLMDKASIKTGDSIHKFEPMIWQLISSLIPGRTSEACHIKALTLIPSNIADSPWIKEEDQILLEIIQKLGSKQWKLISFELFQKNPLKIFRTSKQCRQRYMCYLKPDLKKGYWTKPEDYQLICLFLKYGRKWAKMANQITGRNQNAIKNRFFLLFDINKNGSKQYHSELMRKVGRKKQNLEKILLNNHAQEHITECIQSPPNSEISDGSRDELVNKQPEKNVEQFADYEKFFTF